MAEDSNEPNRDDDGEDLDGAEAGSGGDLTDELSDEIGETPAEAEESVDEANAKSGGGLLGFGVVPTPFAVGDAVAGARRGAETRRERVDRLEETADAWGAQIKNAEEVYGKAIEEINVKIEEVEDEIEAGTSMPEEGAEAASRLTDTTDLQEALDEARDRAPEPEGEVTEDHVEEAAELLGFEEDVTEAPTPSEGFLSSLRGGDRDVDDLSAVELEETMRAALRREQAEIAARGVKRRDELEETAEEFEEKQARVAEDRTTGVIINELHDDISDENQDLVEGGFDEEAAIERANAFGEAAMKAYTDAIDGLEDATEAAEVVGDAADNLITKNFEIVDGAPDVSPESGAEKITAADVPVDRPSMDDLESEDGEAVVDAVVTEFEARTRAAYRQADANVVAAKESRRDSLVDDRERKRRELDAAVAGYERGRRRHERRAEEARESLEKNGNGYDGFGNRVQARASQIREAAASALEFNPKSQVVADRHDINEARDPADAEGDDAEGEGSLTDRLANENGPGGDGPDEVEENGPDGFERD